MSGRSVIVLSDRYSATGRPRPNPKTVCRGPCEGMGVYPDMRGYAAGKYGRDKGAFDRVPFLTCPDCDGTGLRK